MRHHYPSPKQFLDSARLHQRRWVKSELKVEPSHSKRVLIPAVQAFAGKNFFNNHTVESVRKRYPKSFKPRKDGTPKPIIADALRSEHIPFNLFAPLVKSIGTEPLISFFADLSNTQISDIDQILFEYAPQDAVAILQDNTSFDACIIASQGQRKVVIGIEVKYTEGPYPWGATEKSQMFNESSPYVSVSQESRDIVTDAYESLRNPHLKQIWRNYLLAIATGMAGDCDFVYIHLYPKSNKYQSTVCESFTDHLTPNGDNKFQPCTYESFINLLETHLPKSTSDWTQYLTNRYVL